jgi:hypothetical protein
MPFFPQLQERHLFEISTFAFFLALKVSISFYVSSFNEKIRIVTRLLYAVLIIAFNHFQFFVVNIRFVLHIAS